MLLVKDNRNKEALIFSSELENDISQNIVYCLPFFGKITKIDLLINFLQKRNIVMPFAINDNIIYLIGKISFPYINFDLNEIEKNEIIQFRIYLKDKLDRSLFSELMRFLIAPYLKLFQIFNPIKNRCSSSEFISLNYIGYLDKLLKKDSKYLILIPTDVTLLNKLYREFKLVPVGYSPNFGNYFIEELTTA